MSRINFVANSNILEVELRFLRHADFFYSRNDNFFPVCFFSYKITVNKDLNTTVCILVF